ncbi:MAG: S8 family serine peptidase [Methanosarcinaceae archaeon]|nr:S8 family serine peptidase [Methanosarcinaceae archaeon]
MILLSITVVPAIAAPSGLKIFENDFFTTSGDEYVQEEFIVKFKSDVGKNKIAEINSKNGASIKRANPHFMMMNVPQGRTVSQMVESYSRNPNVEYAEPNYIAYAHMIPNDEYYDLQWHLDINTSKENTDWHGENGGGINIEPAWDIATGTGVVVAVIDTGVAYEDRIEEIRNRAGKLRQVITYAQAPDLANTHFVSGYDFVNDDKYPNDDAGHGTHVAGTIAQSTNNELGIAGVAFNSSIMPIKVLDKEGYGTYDDIVSGIYYAADHGAQVISMSLGGPDPSISLENALAYAYDKGVTIVCSAGNNGAGAPPSYPAAYDAYCIAVGATRYDETVSSYSTTGDYVDIAAPGGDLNVDQNGDSYGDGVLQQTHNGIDYTNFGYYFYQGTSMAAPHVSGVAALLISYGVTGPDNVREAIESTAEDKGPVGLDSGYGHGIVDAYAALQWSATPNEPPVADDQSVITNEDTSISITLNATDYDGDALTYSIVSLPLNGNVAISGITAIYTPTANYNGADSFNFKANDGTTDSNIATVSVTLNEVNDAPIAHNYAATTSENTTIDITLSATDIDDDSLTYNIVNEPANGTVLLSGNTATYTPTANYTGTDNFTFKANDSTVDSNTATVYITVTEPSAQMMHVANIDMSTTRIKLRGWYTDATATLTIVDAYNKPVEGVMVSGNWSELTTGTDSGTTNVSGQVALSSNKVQSAVGTFTFTVTDIVLEGWTYEYTEPDSGSISV